MSKVLIALSALSIITLGFFSYKVTYALFSDDASSQDNTFSAASEFPASPGDVVINEIMWPGSSLNINDEWLELRNMTSSPVDLAGWTLEGAAAGSNIITISSGTITANGFFLISNFDETHPTSILNINPDVTDTTIQLDNTNLQIILKNASNTIIDTADDGSSTPFAGSNVNPRTSMERNSIPGNGTISTNWHSATTSVNLDLTASESATPRAANSS